MRQACKVSQLAEVPASEGLAQVRARPRVGGKFLFIADRKFYIKGVTYGTFRPDADGSQFPDSKTVERDFHLIADSGINAVRTYTVPPRDGPIAECVAKPPSIPTKAGAPSSHPRSKSL